MRPQQKEGLPVDDLATKDRPFNLQGFSTQDHQCDSAATMLSWSLLMVNRLGWRAHITGLWQCLGRDLCTAHVLRDTHRASWTLACD